MGWEKIADLASGIFDRFFSRESIKERRRNQIESLKTEQREILKKPHTARGAKRLRAIRERLSALERDAKND